ncbi:MAG TPA: DUF3060 domain-containing protein [Kofleriaceae bacterium]|nr:DUF3060 domain-containing protein [Kofleriaceae bacterium]
MRSVLVAVLLALPAAAAADRVYTDKAAAHDCAKEPNVSINTGEGTFTFTGPCEKIGINGGKNKVTIESVKKLVVNGSKNIVDVDAADKIGVNGADNTINYKRGVTEKTPKVGAIGANNKLNPIK